MTLYPINKIKIHHTIHYVYVDPHQIYKMHRNADHTIHTTPYRLHTIHYILHTTHLGTPACCSYWDLRPVYQRRWSADCRRRWPRSRSRPSWSDLCLGESVGVCEVWVSVGECCALINEVVVVDVVAIYIHGATNNTIYNHTQSHYTQHQSVLTEGCCCLRSVACRYYYY